MQAGEPGGCDHPGRERDIEAPAFAARAVEISPQQRQREQQDHPARRQQVARPKEGQLGPQQAVPGGDPQQVVGEPAVMRAVEQHGAPERQRHRRHDQVERATAAGDRRVQQQRRGNHQRGLLRQASERQANSRPQAAGTRRRAAAKPGGAQGQEEEQRIDTREVEPAAARGERGGEQPRREQPHPSPAALPRHESVDQSQDAERGGQRDQAQRQEPAAGRLRHQGRQVVVERRVDVRHERHGRGDVERRPGEDARNMIDAAPLHPLELVGVGEAAGRDDEIGEQADDGCARDDAPHQFFRPDGAGHGQVTPDGLMRECKYPPAEPGAEFV